ncbi:LuxR C-terminal-related transcriptional regulator [Nonomuraea sp. NPDC050663]|uniref:helix-turn-helix transcriptional regulator n=1 Tax=Nonomuraea sp. NPDC050663 TaxID=3364370 RepID=UPI0037B5C1E8
MTTHFDSIVAGAREGRSAALVLRGERGTGDCPQPVDISVLRCSGVESEMELPFAALQLLLRPLTKDLDLLPEPQREAMKAAFGLARGAVPDRFLIGLATLTLLAEHGPLLCLVDDAQWLDRASTEALVFAARRLDAEGVVLIFATRSLERDLLSVLPEVRTDEAGADPARLREGYERQVAGLPAPTRRALLALAAEADLDAVLRATGLTAEALAPAERAGLIEVGAALAEDGRGLASPHRSAYRSVGFRHALVRAVAYEGAPFAERAAVHLALAKTVDPERRAWHLAAAATGPDEYVAAELEKAAGLAREQAGYAEAGAALERAARLSPDPGERARRLAGAAVLAADSGQSERAMALIEQSARRGEVSPELVRLRARIEFEHGSPQEAWRLLLGAGPELVIEAARVAWLVGDVAGLRAARERVSGDGREPLLTGAVELLAGDPARGLELIRANHADAGERGLRIGETSLALLEGDYHLARQGLLAVAADLRARGAIGWLPGVLAILAETETLLGGDARPWASEALRMAEDTGQVRHAAHARGLLAFDTAIRGEHVTADGDWAERARALLDLGDGHFDAALERLEALQHRPYALHFLPDQIEAAVRAGHRDRAPLGRFEAWARTANRPWALAAAHRCRALLAEQPEEHFEQAVHCADLPWQQARSRLVYGEWLRRERRKNEARAQLREALESFEKAGARPWADHARAELRAAGESVTPAAGDLRAALTPQELQIVRLAATGATNKEIGAQLFLSPKTVGHHLYRAFPKLGVSNRTELARLMG